MDDFTDSIFEIFDITNWDKPWLSVLDITSGISEINLLISDFSIVDFRFSGIAICDF